MNFEGFANTHLGAIYDALQQMEDDGHHEDFSNEQEIESLVLAIRLEIEKRMPGYTFQQALARLSPYSEEMGFQFH